MDAIPTDAHVDAAREMIAVLLPAATDDAFTRTTAWLADQLAKRDDAARRGLGGNLPPEPIDPEKLLRIPASDVPALLVRSYGPLAARGAELLENATAWQTDKAKIPIADQQEADDLADLMDELAKYAHPKNGEVEPARRRVKEPLFEAGKAVDLFFANLRNPLLAIMGIDPYPAAPTTMQAHLTAWQRAKVAREAAIRAQEAETARLAAIEANKAARIPEADDDALIAATVAEETAQQAQQAAAAPANELARSTTARGTGLGLRANWTFRVVDIQTTILAAAMPIVMERLAGIQEVTTAGLLRIIRETLTPPGGPVPLDYLVTNDSLIRAGIKGDRGRRECPGLEIFNDAQASRRSG